MKIRKLIIGTLVAPLLSIAVAQGQVGNAPGSGPNGRFLAVISDLHFGLGRSAAGPWHPIEDFRWRVALAAFLDEISRVGNNAVDLIIAGDTFELWQPPESVKCTGASADLGCTVEEMVEIASVVARAHEADLKLLREFASRGENRVHLIPGNHDSTLLIDEVWAKFAEPLAAKTGRVQLVRSGVWTSADGRVVIEHGHQIGADVNRYGEWPKIVREQDGVRYVVRPWGERFVQRVFNEQEVTYSIIDNLSPETAGARYRMADRGVWGTAADMARFVAFNIFETSGRQKVAALGPPKGENELSKWNLDMARNTKHELFVAALRDGDPFRAALLGNDPEAKALQTELDKLVRDRSRMPDAELRALCDLAAAGSKDGWKLCRPAELGALLQSTFVPLSWVVREHLIGRMRDFKAMNVFIYGHTHQIQPRWDLAVTSVASVAILNTGAFQRLVDEDGFLARARAKNWSEAETLRQLTPENLAPCYGVVIVPYRNRLPDPVARVWWMPETGSTGKLLSPGDEQCK